MTQCFSNGRKALKNRRFPRLSICTDNHLHDDCSRNCICIRCLFLFITRYGNLCERWSCRETRPPCFHQSVLSRRKFCRFQPAATPRTGAQQRGRTSHGAEQQTAAHRGHGKALLLAAQHRVSALPPAVCPCGGVRGLPTHPPWVPVSGGT